MRWSRRSSSHHPLPSRRATRFTVADISVVAMPTFNAMTYHDAPLSAGKTYVYTIIAMNDAGHSAPSNEVMVAIP